MFLPIFLIFIAVLCGGVVAYGTHPEWAQYEHGMAFIMASRRIQWPLVALSLVLCVALIGMVISGRRRAWWLIGLAPVLAMFVHRFASDPYGQLAIVDQPVFAVAADAVQGLPADDAQVVGLQFSGATYAYPVAALDTAPVIVQAVHDKHLMVFWSPAANRATATAVERQVKARDLEVVSAPAGSLLVYDGRLGQFISAVTGQTPGRQKPVGFSAPIPTTRTTWKRWRVDHPETSVMTSPAPATNARPLPAAPLPLALANDLKADTSVIMIDGKRPIALLPQQVSAAPLNARVGDVAVLVFRDSKTGEIRAFDRRLEDDLIPTFRVNTDAKRKGAALYDPDTGSGWDLNGVAVSGKKEFLSRRLQPLQAEEGLPWGVMKFWYPELQLVTDQSVTTASADDQRPAPIEPATRTSSKAMPHKPRSKAPPAR